MVLGDSGEVGLSGGTVGSRRRAGNKVERRESASSRRGGKRKRGRREERATNLRAPLLTVGQTDPSPIPSE